MLATKRCDPCGKSFTGPVSYNQHLDSEKHKRKILSLSLQNGSSRTEAHAPSTATQISQQTLECPVCAITFNSLENFQIHSISREHAVKVMEKNSEKNTTSEVAVSLSSNNDKNLYHSESDSILPPNEVMKSQLLAFASCQTCNKIFSGPEPYKQHIESALHAKKVELEKSLAGSRLNENIVTLYCDTCKKHFSGQVPYMQHIESKTHQKKILNLQLSGKETLDIDSLPMKEPKADESNQNNAWFCDICKIQCSGYIPFQQHLSGITHLKNITKAKRENYTIKPEDSTQLAFENRSKDNNNLNVSYTANVSIRQLNDGNVNKDKDYILPGMVDNLKIMSTEELENSVKVFLPGQDIDFDNADKEMDTDSTKEKIQTSEDVQMHEIEDSSAYQTCNFCDVNLKSQEEALNHLESLGHFLKRW